MMGAMLCGTRAFDYLDDLIAVLTYIVKEFSLVLALFMNVFLIKWCECAGFGVNSLTNSLSPRLVLLVLEPLNLMFALFWLVGLFICS